jgi:hypothetical protein
MKKLLPILFLIVLLVGCGPKIVEEDISEINVEEEKIVQENVEKKAIDDKVVGVPGNVIAKYKEDFEKELSEDWLFSKYITLEPSPQGVYFEDGNIKLVAEETDRVPIMSSTPYPIDDAKYITINARLKTNFANEYYTGAMGIFFTDSPNKEVELNEESWSSSFGRRPIQVEYVNYLNDSSRRIIDNGFIMYTSSEKEGADVQAFESGVFDEWFDQQLIINMETGEVICTINGETLTSVIDIPVESYLRIWIHPYGWFTGHEVIVDSIDIYFSK